MGDVVLRCNVDFPAHDNFQTLYLRADRQQGLQACLRQLNVDEVRLWRCREEEVVVPESVDLLLLFVDIDPASQGCEKTIVPADSKCSVTSRG